MQPKSEQSEPLVADSDTELDSTTYIPRTREHHLGRRKIIYALCGAAIASILWSLGVIALMTSRLWTTTATTFPQHPSGRDNIHILHCGDTPAEARAMGCKFQIHTYAWVPAPCFDGVLQKEWLDIRDWEYYTDKYDQGEPVNISVALAGERNLYSTWGQHIEHCAFTWRKFTRAQAGSGVLLTNRDLSYEHAHHCSDALRTKFEHPWEEVNTKVTVEFHMC
ncbi:hypothetical protein CNMCM5793_009663 [Aspergillus hiratsukae]|uniref:Uncharacterized protein n=1 Tax=Aspergillus hiratsukae TaxID=1194566 RepID=A0A8H6P0H4_9EURO|nr:hypothetical protein CNMCM5793_009663 [Aspergillus hiratsukae]KAF7156191.1 hypothetical protein CNMCM6106_009256 [Aspergillus hiratsukae]